MFGPLFRAGMRIVVLALAFLSLFALSFAAFAWGLSWLRGGDVFSQDQVILALVCNLIAWLFLAVFHLGKETVLLPVPQRGFVERASRLLQDMGYEITTQTADTLGTRPRFKSLLLGWGIQVHCLGSHARISGPKMWVELFRRRLRWQHHLDLASGGLSRRRGDDHLIKRVQIQARLSQEQWDAFRAEVLEPLAQQADLVCEVNLLAQSETGIRESLVDGPVRDWLESNQVAADIHKDHARLQEPQALVVSGAS